MYSSRMAIGLLLAAAAAHAQSPVPPASAPPAAGGTPPALQYRSAFDGYRPNPQIEVESWSRANDVAAAIGGHVGLMKRDATPATPAKPAPSAATPASSPSGSAPTRP
jgi:hypothetical protein